MAKQGMKRIDRTHSTERNTAPAVPEIQGKAKHGKEPIPADIYPVIDNDLARDNLENDLSAADQQDL